MEEGPRFSEPFLVELLLELFEKAQLNSVGPLSGLWSAGSPPSSQT